MDIRARSVCPPLPGDMCLWLNVPGLRASVLNHQSHQIVALKGETSGGVVRHAAVTDDVDMAVKALF